MCCWITFNWWEHSEYNSRNGLFLFRGKGRSDMVKTSMFPKWERCRVDYFFPISKWLVVNHGQALKKDQVLARKQFWQNMIICLILPPSNNCFRQNQPFLHNRSILFVLAQNHNECCGRVTFSKGPRAGCVQAAEFVWTVQNPIKQFKIP